MKQKMLNILSLLCIAALLFYGCTGPQKEPDITESLIWESAPALNFGTMTHEKLKVEPWYSGRCEATGNSCFAETELGYYLSLYGKLYYADKADLSFWVPVCNQPDCTHSHSWSYGQPRCNAKVNSFVIRDGRIYFADTVSVLWDHYSMVSDTDGFCIASRALDGTDLRLAYKDDSMSPGGGGFISVDLNYNYALYDVGVLNADGSFTYRLYRLSDNGSQLLSDRTTTQEIPSGYISYNGRTTWGEATFYHYFLDESFDFLYGFKSGDVVKYDVSCVEGECYLAGNQLRIYRANDGYYDVDLATQKEVRVADAQLEDAYAHILLPNCILETTLQRQRQNTLAVGTPHALKLFNGETWLDVQLPQELSEAGNGQYILIAGVTSDSIFVIYPDNRSNHLYRIPLDTDTPVMECCADLR